MKRREKPYPENNYPQDIAKARDFIKQKNYSNALALLKQAARCCPEKEEHYWLTVYVNYKLGQYNIAAMGYIDETFKHKSTNENQLLKAKIQLKQHKLDEAYSSLMPIIVSAQHTGDNSLLARAYAVQANILTLQGKFAEAGIIFSTAITLQPTKAKIHCDYASLLIKQKKFSEALKMIEKAFLIKPNDGMILAHHGYLSFRKGNIPEAILALEKSLGFLPTNEVAYRYLAEIYHIRDVEKCNKYLDSIEFDDSITLQIRGEICLGQQDLTQAEHYFNESLLLCEINDRALCGKAKIYLANKNLEAALVAINKAIQINNNNAEYHFLRGQINWLKDGSGLIDFDKAIEIRPDYYMAYKERAILHNKFKQYDKALMDLEYLLGVEPDNLQYLNLAIFTYTEIKNHNKALELLNRIISIKGAFKTENIHYYIARAKSSSDLNQFQNAINDLSLVLEAQPEHIRSLNLRGAFYKRLGQLDKAIIDLNKAIELDPKTSSQNMRIDVFMAQGDFLAAHNAIQQIIHLDPTDHQLYFKLALTELMLKKYEPALDSIEKALQESPQNTDYLRRKCEILVELKQFDKAEPIINELLAKNSGDKILKLKALILLAQNNNDEALESITTVCEKYPNDLQALNFKKMIYFKKQDLNNAIACCKQLITLKPQTAIYVDLASAYNMLDEVEQAKHNIAEAMKLTPDHPDALFILAKICVKENDRASALVNIDKSIAKRPSLHTYKFRAELYLTDKKLDEAFLDLDKMLELDPNSRFALMHQGDIHLQRGECVLALAKFDRVIEICPNDSEALSLRGEIHYKNENYQRAYIDLFSAVQITPEDINSITLLGYIEYKLGCEQDALKHIVKAIELGASNSAELYEFCGDIASMKKDSSQAIKFYTEALKYDMSNASLIIKLATEHSKQSETHLDSPTRSRHSMFSGSETPSSLSGSNLNPHSELGSP